MRENSPILNIFGGPFLDRRRGSGLTQRQGQAVFFGGADAGGVVRWLTSATRRKEQESQEGLPPFRVCLAESRYRRPRSLDSGKRV